MKKSLILFLFSFMFATTINCKVAITDTNSSQTLKQENKPVKTESVISNFNFNQIIQESYNITPEKLALITGESQKIEATFKDISDKNITGINFVSLDNNIASVDLSGIVKGISTGKTFIKIFTIQEPDKFVLIPVVIDFPEKTENYIKIIPSPITLEFQKTLNIKAEILKSNDTKMVSGIIQWATQNSKIAEVDKNGTLKAIGTGETFIDAIYTNEQGKQFVNSTKVIVQNSNLGFSKEDYFLQEIKSSSQNLLLLPDQEKQIKVQMIYNFNRTENNARFESFNPDIASVDNSGKIKGLKEGKTVISIKSFKDPLKPYYIPVLVKNIPEKPDNIQLKSNMITINKAFQTDIKNYIAEPGNYSYFVEKTDIADVTQEGKLTAKSEGISRVFITSVKNPEIKTYIWLRVFKENDILPVFLNKTTATKNGDKYSAQIKWNINSDNYQYQVYRDNKLINTVKENTFTDENLTSKSYNYHVITCQDKTCSEKSNNRTVLIPVPDSPEIKQSASVLQENKLLVSLDWEIIPGTTYYNIYRDEKLSGKSAVNNFKDIVSGFSGLPAFDYNVTACNDSGCSEDKKIIRIIPPMPVSPVISEKSNFIRNNQNVVSIKWIKQNEINYYKLYRDTTLVYIGNNTSFEDTGVNSGYLNYTLVSCNGSGCSNETKSEVINTLSKPSVSLLLQPSVSKNQDATYNISLSWSNTINRDKDDFYRLYRNNAVIYSGKDTLFSDQNNSSAENYYYVEACNSFGCSSSVIIKSSY